MGAAPALALPDSVCSAFGRGLRQGVRLRRTLRLLLVLLTATLTLVMASPAHARKVRVRGGSQLLAQARFLRSSDVLELSGRLVDDAREPLEGGWVEVRSKGALDVSKARGCPAPQVTVAPLEGGLRVQSAANGEICLRWREAPDKGTVVLQFGGDAYHGATELGVDFDRSKPQLLGTAVRFEPRPAIVDLDKERVAVSGVLELSLATAHASREGLPVVLLDEKATQLATGTTGGDGKVRFTVDPKLFGAPGTGKLRLDFQGNDELAPASDEQAVTRRATVKLRIADDVEPADPGDTTEILLDVVASHDHGPVDGGVVEALRGGSSVGSGTVTEGKVRLVVLIADVADKQTSVELGLRYLPSSPSYRPGPPLTVEVPIAPPSVLLRVLLTIVVVAAGAWVMASWRRSKELPSLSRGQRTLTPGVHVVHSTRGAKEWKGTVVDAHEGDALVGVRLIVRAPTLEGDGVLLETETDHRGMFAFDLAERPDGAELITYSPTHSEERKALPAGGTLRIALITRRRALLRRFVSWARVRGRPYDTKPDPTPSQVRDTATEQLRGDVSTWAAAVEEAAFGPGEVDEAAEGRVRDLEPGP